MANPKTNRIKSRRAYWRNHVQQWRKSGLSQAAYCRKHGLVDQQLSQWKIKLQDDMEVMPARSQKSKGSALPIASSPSQHFVEVKLEEKHCEPYRIMLANGRSLCIGNPYNPAMVAELVSILEQPC